MDEPPPARIPLDRGLVALLDAADLPRAATLAWRAEWCSFPRKGGMWRVASRAKHPIYLHRFLLDAGPDEVVTHVNDDGLDNRRENLRRWRKVRRRARP
jgi:hypothetical protein